MSIRIIAMALLLLCALSAYAQKPITLLPHQEFPIDYLLKHKDVKGLIVNHYMGTGKTYLAIGFAEKLADKKVVILAPRFIEAHWRQHLKDFPVKNQKRYQFVSYNDAPQVLIGLDLRNTVLLMDEVHNLIRLIKSADPDTNKRYSDLYIHLRNAHKILALSGTPIYNDEYDFAYLVNLVSGSNLMPFNEEQFRIQYSSVKKGRSFWRGYVFESNILKQSAPVAAALCAIPLYVVGGAALGATVTIVGSLGTALAFPLVSNLLAPVEKYPLRELDASKFQPFISQLVSFYEIENVDMSHYPSKAIHVEEVNYNAEQFWFFLNFAEKSLGNKGLSRMFKDINQNFGEAYLSLNTTILQDRLANTAGAGREIGNFDFEGDISGSVIESPKFLRVLGKMKSQNMPKSVVYSSYFENGTMAFSRFLDRRGLQASYAVLQPDMSPDQFAEVVESYNAGKIKILLLHPEIMEGISLKGTRQFHILEPVTNLTVQNQVIARAVRYQSHSMLPASERHVDVYIWKSKIGSSLSTLKLQKANWFKRYSEMSDWSNFGQGISQIDKNYDRKKLSPDEQAFLRLESVNQNMDALKAIMNKQSVEKGHGPLLALQPITSISDDHTGLELDPLVLPKTNFKTFWLLGHKLLGSHYAIESLDLGTGFGVNIEVDVPLSTSISSGFYLENYWGQNVKRLIIDPIDPLGSEARTLGQNTLGFGGFVRTQLPFKSEIGNFALSLRIPVGAEVIFGESLVPLYKDQADLNQFAGSKKDVWPGLSSGKLGYGISASFTAGLEYFPMEFAGLTIEAGYRASYHSFPVTVRKEILETASEFVGFRGYSIHGWTVSTGVKLTY